MIRDDIDKSMQIGVVHISKGKPLGKNVTSALLLGHDKYVCIYIYIYMVYHSY